MKNCKNWAQDQATPNFIYEEKFKSKLPPQTGDLNVKQLRRVIQLLCERVLSFCQEAYQRQMVNKELRSSLQLNKKQK